MVFSVGSFQTPEGIRECSLFTWGGGRENLLRIHCREVCEGLGSEKTPETYIFFWDRSKVKWSLCSKADFSISVLDNLEYSQNQLPLFRLRWNIGHWEKGSNKWMGKWKPQAPFTYTVTGEALLGVSLLPAPFTFSSSAPCSLEFSILAPFSYFSVPFSIFFRERSLFTKIVHTQNLPPPSTTAHSFIREQEEK